MSLDPEELIKAVVEAYKNKLITRKQLNKIMDEIDLNETQLETRSQTTSKAICITNYDRKHVYESITINTKRKYDLNQYFENRELQQL